MRFVLLLTTLLLPAVVYAQGHHRLRADFTIKEKRPDTTDALVMGTVYYDKFERRIVYQINFPQAATWIHADTSLYHLRDGKVEDRQTLPDIIEFTIFHLALNQSLTDFGLKKSPYEIKKVSRVQNQVLTTWGPPDKFADKVGQVVVAQQDKQLAGVAIFNPAGRLLSRQVVRGHLRTGDFSFPAQIVQTHYLTDGRTYQRITSFRKLVVDEDRHDDLYRPAVLAR